MKAGEIEREVIRRTLGELFCAQDAGGVENALSEHFRNVRATVVFDDEVKMQQMSCVWSHTKTGGSCFTFRKLQRGHLLKVVVDRWLSLFDLFMEVDRTRNLEGKVVINFNDAGLDRGLAFCGNSSDFHLIPDHAFLGSRGYAAQRDHFRGGGLPWLERSSGVFWRGSSLGQKGRPILDMPRARLCQIARQTGGDWFDTGFSELLDVSEADAAMLREMDLVRDYCPWQDLGRHRFNVDIDGHASSYAGLFTKLLAGGLVLKVQSPDHFAQWYYDRLRPGVNFVPVRSDLSDLVEVVSYYRHHDEEARRIAEQGRQLALSMTYEKEFAVAIDCVARAFRSRT